MFHQLHESSPAVILDLDLLMWDIQRNINFGLVPEGRVVVHFRFPDAPQAMRTWWLVLEREEADLCLQDPGYPVDLTVETSLFVMTEIWLGDREFRQTARAGKLRMDGPAALARRFPDWLNLSLFAAEQRQTRERKPENKGSRTTHDR